MLLGITSLGHDASVAVVEDGRISFAGHAERYSRIKNDGNINSMLLEDALRGSRPERIVWYERPLMKAMRFMRAGQWGEIPRTPRVKNHLKSLGLGGIPVSFVGHHESHAAAGFYTSPFDEAAIIVCDAIGEFDTISVWVGEGTKLRCIWRQSYPDSLGLFYSAFTQRIGFKPNEEEYIMMGMAALGKPKYVDAIRNDFFHDASSAPRLRLKHNMHRGIRWWRNDIHDVENIAASVQFVTESYLRDLARWAVLVTGKSNLVMMGGVALNCVANSVIAQSLNHDIWIMPNPGDAGSSLGAIAAHTRERIDWVHPYLGHDIARPFYTGEVASRLACGEVVGVASGRAEFGPRALGNRSLMADPRGPDVQDRVNRIKKREAFRPFAPVIKASKVKQYFDLPVDASPYMQFVGRVKDPESFPAITHVDGSARVQTVTREQNRRLWDLLDAFEAKTGCPMLLNTSLNIKGEPLVNTIEDANRFSERYGVQVF